MTVRRRTVFHVERRSLDDGIAVSRESDEPDPKPEQGANSMNNEGSLRERTPRIIRDHIERAMADPFRMMPVEVEALERLGFMKALTLPKHLPSMRDTPIWSAEWNRALAAAEHAVRMCVALDQDGYTCDKAAAIAAIMSKVREGNR